MTMLFLTLVILGQTEARFSGHDLHIAPNVKSEIDNEKADFKHLRMVADIEDAEAHKEEKAAHNDELDGEAIEKAATATAKTELDRATKYLPKGQDQDAAFAAAHGEQAQKFTDAEQMEDVAAKEKKDAADTEKDVTRMRQDAAAIEAIVMPAKAVVLSEAQIAEAPKTLEIDNEMADFKHLRMVADIEDEEAHKEEKAAHNDELDGEAIEKAAASTAKTELDRATKYLPVGKDRDAAVAAAHGEEAQKDTDAKQMKDVAAKEKTDAADTEKDVTRMRQDAAAIEAIVMPNKVAALMQSDEHKPKALSPPLENVKSDKKFFGPPFPADYPEDSRPVAQKSILDKLKGPDQPYPALQSKADYDRDYVKDENGDKGAWKNQMQYDWLRKKLARSTAAEKRAAEEAARRKAAEDAAQRKADGAGKDVDDAKRGVDDANKAGDGANGNDAGDADAGAAPSLTPLEEMKKKVTEAEANYEKEKKEFAECERLLAASKKNLEELKAKQAEMEKQLASDTKLWIESKTTRLSVHKAKEDAAHTKVLAAQTRLKEAQAAKAEKDTVLAAKKARKEVARKEMQQKKTHLENFKKRLAKATLTLQKLRGYHPSAPEGAVMHGAAPMTSALLSMLVLLTGSLF